MIEEKSLLAIYQEGFDNPRLGSLNHIAGLTLVYNEGYRIAFKDSLGLQEDRERLINLCDSKDKEINRLKDTLENIINFADTIEGADILAKQALNE